MWIMPSSIWKIRFGSEFLPTSLRKVYQPEKSRPLNSGRQAAGVALAVGGRASLQPIDTDRTSAVRETAHACGLVFLFIPEEPSPHPLPSYRERGNCDRSARGALALRFY